MSLFGAMNSAISGLTAQSDAFGDISDNVANSQTVGFKRVDTSFVDYLTTSTATRNDPGAVVARPNYVNDVQGTITQTDSPLNVAIAGQGFFAVSQETGIVAGQPTFNPQQFYSRAGDFTLNNQGYMVNSAGQFLNGWVTDPATGIIDQNALVPIQIAQTALNPVATSNVDLSANLPATPATGTATAAAPISSDITVYDALGTAHTVTLGWSQNAANDWTVTVTAPDAATPAVGTADVQFGPILTGNAVPAGTIGQIGSVTGNITTNGYSAGSAATMSMVMDFGSGPQTVNLNVGTYGGATGVTQYAGTTYNLRGPQSGRRAPRQLRRRDDAGQRQHRGELQQRPDPDDRPDPAGDLQRAGLVATAEWPVVHRHHRVRRSPGGTGEHQWRRQPRGQFGGRTPMSISPPSSPS